MHTNKTRFLGCSAAMALAAFIPVSASVVSRLAHTTQSTKAAHELNAETLSVFLQAEFGHQRKLEARNHYARASNSHHVRNLLFRALPIGHRAFGRRHRQGGSMSLRRKMRQVRDAKQKKTKTLKAAVRSLMGASLCKPVRPKKNSSGVLCII